MAHIAVTIGGQINGPKLSEEKWYEVESQTPICKKTRALVKEC